MLMHRFVQPHVDIHCNMPVVASPASPLVITAPVCQSPLLPIKFRQRDELGRCPAAMPIARSCLFTWGDRNGDICPGEFKSLAHCSHLLKAMFHPMRNGGSAVYKGYPMCVSSQHGSALHLAALNRCGLGLGYLCEHQTRLNPGDVLAGRRCTAATWWRTRWCRSRAAACGWWARAAAGCWPSGGRRPGSRSTSPLPAPPRHRPPPAQAQCGQAILAPGNLRGDPHQGPPRASCTSSACSECSRDVALHCHDPRSAPGHTASSPQADQSICGPLCLSACFLHFSISSALSCAHGPGAAGRWWWRRARGTWCAWRWARVRCARPATCPSAPRRAAHRSTVSESSG